MFSPWEVVGSDFLVNSNAAASHWSSLWCLIFIFFCFILSPPPPFLFLAREWWPFRSASTWALGNCKSYVYQWEGKGPSGCRILYMTKLSDLEFPFSTVRRFVITITDDNILRFNRRIKKRTYTNNEHLWLLFRIIWGQPLHFLL